MLKNRADGFVFYLHKSLFSKLDGLKMGKIIRRLFYDF